MVKYENGKIYKLVDNTNGNIYIGSTAEPLLARRLAKHKNNYKTYLHKKYHFLTSFIIMENQDYDIVLIENFPCSSKDELHARERFFIESLDCVNKQRPGRTHKEHYLDNRERILEYSKQYRIKNKERISEYNKQPEQRVKINLRQRRIVDCPCGKNFSYGHRSRHEKSKRHQNYINNSSIQS